MRKNPILAILLLFTLSLFAQQNNDSKLFVIHFSDKGISQDAAINPALYLSGKALDRRLKYNIAFDQSDISVNESYVNKIAALGAKVITRSRWFNTIVIETTQSISDKISGFSFISEIEQLPNQPNNERSASDKSFFAAEKINPWTGTLPKQPAGDYYNYGSAYNQINQLKGQYLHNQGFRGQGMTIAVIDAGFNSVDVMQCFDSIRKNNQIKGTRDFAVPGNNVYATTMHTHGTSVLSCMAANVPGQMVGTAPKANYWLLRSEVGESESIIEEYYWVSAAEFADSVGVDLINSSLGYTTFDNAATNHKYSDMNGNTTIVTKGADKAAQKGILVVNSAGNDGSNSWKYIGAPADGDSVFTIGAVDVNGNRASFSSLGPTYDRRIKPTVDARGVSCALYSPSGFGSGSGTSFSSPIICGMTACFWQASPQKNNMQIIEALKNASSQAQHPDSLLGWGIPNYQQAFITLTANAQAIDKQNLQVYPNPVSDKFTITIPASFKGKFNLEIINTSGQVVYTAEKTGVALQTIQINNIGYLQPGIYLVRVSNGTVNYTARMIRK